MAYTEASPFRYEGPVEADDLIGRHDVLDQLVRALVERRTVSLAAPRRYGKTSLLRAAAGRVEREQDFLAVHVDLLGLAGPDDFAARLGSAWRRAVREHRSLRRELERVLGGLSSIGVSLLGAGVQLTRRSPDAQAALTLTHTLLDLPARADQPVLVVLDEFQSLHAAWPDGEGVLRSHAQSPDQAGKVAWAFAGSEPSLLAAAFNDRGRAYYQQVMQVQVPRLDAGALARAISDRFTATSRGSGTAIGPLLDLADGHPQRAMLLAHLLWTRTARGRTADEDCWNDALADARALTRDEATAIWESLTAVQRQALAAVALTGSPTSGQAGQTASRASRQTAAEALRRRGLIEATGSGSTRRLVDPLLGDWIRQRTQGR